MLRGIKVKVQIFPGCIKIEANHYMKGQDQYAKFMASSNMVKMYSTDLTTKKKV